MKQLFHFLFVLVIVLCATVLVLIALSTLRAPKDPVLDALPRWESKEFYTSGGFQDSTDYAKYTYRIGKDQLEETGFLHPVKEDNIPDILAYVENFENGSGPAMISQRMIMTLISPGSVWGTIFSY